MASIAITTLLLSLSFLSLRDSIEALQEPDARLSVKRRNYPDKVTEVNTISDISMAELRKRRTGGRKTMVKASETALMEENFDEADSRRRVDSPSVHVKFSGFMDFDADYNVARSHPPRNN